MTRFDPSKLIYVVKGFVTDEEAHNGKAKLGDTEWRFSNDPLANGVSPRTISTYSKVSEPTPIPG